MITARRTLLSQTAGFFAISLAICAVGWLAVIEDLYYINRQSDSEVQILRQIFTIKYRAASPLDAFRAQMEEFETGTLADVIRLLPANISSAEIRRLVFEGASQFGGTVGAFEALKPVVHDSYTEYPFEVDLITDFESLLRFIEWMNAQRPLSITRAIEIHAIDKGIDVELAVSFFAYGREDNLAE